jgi:hypothetical protein
MGRCGDADELSADRERNDANTLWLLAAVLHHQPEDEASPDEDDDG